MEKHPLVSVIITTRNESEVIKNLLMSLRKQTYKNVEIILVDNYSTDTTKLIAKKFTELIFNKDPERSTQRNFGASKAKGKFLLFLDADMELEENVIDECVVVSASKQVGAVIIPEISFGKSFWARVKAFERSFYVGDDTIEAARFFSQEVFHKLGGFDVLITGPEDWDLSDRVRREYLVGRCPSFIHHNEGSLSLGSLMRKKYYYGLKTPTYLKKQKNNTMVSAKTIFFLRKSFYTKPDKIIAHPLLFCAMIVMLFAELAAGIAGTIVGIAHE